MSASIEAVTASFAASMVLAEGGNNWNFDRFAGGSARKSKQSFLLGKVLTHKPVDKEKFKAHFWHIWVLNGKFKVVDKPDDRFLFPSMTARIR